MRSKLKEKANGFALAKPLAQKKIKDDILKAKTTSGNHSRALNPEA